MKRTTLLAVGFATLLSGCDLFTLPSNAPPAATTAAAPAPAPAPAPRPPTLPSSGGILAPGGLDEMSAPVSSPGPAAPVITNTPPAVQTEVAGIGSGIKGRSLDDPKVVGIIAEPARAYFRTKERIAFEIQVPHALSLYEATEGKAPASHEEFMEKVILANQIQLPKLPEGASYKYDPMTKQLMVERPAR